jgi:hypothetical protein
VAAYRKGPVVGTAATDGFAPENYGIRPDLRFSDGFSSYPMCAFVFNASIGNRDALMALLETDDGTENLRGDPADAEEHGNTLQETLTFCKVTAGFRQACALLLKTVGNELFTCNLPILPMQMEDGRYRLYISNPEMNSYGYAVVTARGPIRQVTGISKYPVLPVKFMDSPDEPVGWIGKENDGTKRTFRVKVTPGGVTILDVTLRDGDTAG